MHPTLTRQLSRNGLSADAVPEKHQWVRFLDAVDEAYEANDDDRYLTERSLAISSQEMSDLHTSLSNQRDRLQTIFDSLDDAIVVFDSDLNVETFNPEALRMTGLAAEELKVLNLRDLMQMPQIPLQVAEMMSKYLDFAQQWPSYSRVDDVKIQMGEGRTGHWSVGFVPVAHDGVLEILVSVIRDLSELKRYELELRDAQKLEAVGRLAAGIAHEINTPVQFVNDNIRFFAEAFSAFREALEASAALRTSAMATEELAVAISSFDEALGAADVEFFKDEADRAIEQSQDGMERVATIVRAMKTFAHPGSAARAPADLNNALLSTLTVARSEIRYVADVVEDLGALPMVPCFIAELNQVLLNLLVNAAHAIAEKNKGTDARGVITLRTKATRKTVTIQVSDTGTGIPEAARSHVFEPFFTTKGVGVGTGQGLSLAHGVVVGMHGGTLSFETYDGEGTTFTIELPLPE